MPDKEDSTSNALKSDDKSASKDASDAPKEQKKDKDGNVENGKGTQEEELSEEDQKLKDELDMLVERLLEPDASLYKPALQNIKTFIKTSTSSMTAVPKPLKFLRPHYESLEKAYESWPEGENKVGITAIAKEHD
jgi:26S proteasome regulatory subunit N1